MRVLFLLGGFMIAAAGAAAATTAEVVRTQMLSSALFALARPLPAATVERYLSTLRPDGSWPDIPYDNQDRSLWPPVEHLHRILAIVEAIPPQPASATAEAMSTSPFSTAEATKSLHQAAILALRYWVARNPQSTNWWWNTIGLQQALTPVLLQGRTFLMRDAPDVWTSACAQLARSHVDRMTGANLAWEAANLFALGALTDNEARMSRMIHLISADVTVTTQEGIQPDWSFHQHGPQLNAGNYGLSFVPTAAQYALLVRGTSLAFPPGKIALLDGFQANFQEWVVWGRDLDLSSCGRQVDQPDEQTKKAMTLSRAGLLLGELEPDRAAHWRAFDERVRGRLPPEAGAPTGDRYYWRSDFLVHRPGRWYASVKMFSPRVLRTETKVNHENYRGYHLCDGMMQLMIRGDEYENIQPVWNWRQLPGVTFKVTTAPFPYGNHPNTDHNPCAFVGGEGSGGFAVAAMEIVKEDVRAHKAWFCFPDGIVCLGNDIACPADEPVTTDINQCLLRGDVKPLDTDGVRGVWHDGVGYVLLAPGALHYTAGPQTGSWALLRKEGVSAKPVTQQVFDLWIDHGVRPRGAAYAYAILPGCDPARRVDVPYRVIANGAAQIVSDGAVVEAVFHAAGRSPAIGRVPAFQVDRPCIVLARPVESGGTTYAVVDPTQTQSRVVLTPAAAAPIRVALRTGGDAGAPTAVTSR